LWNFAGSQSLSGENVTETTALTYAAVWNAVELISSTIAALPLNLMQGSDKKGRIAEDYKLFNVMHNQWNPFLTAKKGRQIQISSVLTWGNSYDEIVRNGYGEIIQMWPIHPGRVSPLIENGQLYYSIMMPGGPNVVLPRPKVLHLIGPSEDGFIGMSRIGIARKSIGLGMAMETFGSNYFGRGTHPSSVISYKNDIKDIKTAREAIKEVYSGLGKSHDLMMLPDAGMEIKNLAIPMEDSQFLESRQFGIQEVARWFNVPPHKLKDLTRSSFNNIESEDASFLRDRILPDLVELEQSYDIQLLTETERNRSGRGKLYFKHNVKGLLRADTAARTEFYTAMLDRGVFCIDDVLDLEDMPTLANDLGQKRLVQANMTTLENAGKPQEPKPAPTKKQGEGGNDE
jgi:HK97 family phage portal protein